MIRRLPYTRTRFHDTIVAGESTRDQKAKARIGVWSCESGVAAFGLFVGRRIDEGAIVDMHTSSHGQAVCNEVARAVNNLCLGAT